MLGRFRSVPLTVRKVRLSTLVATEEFPFSASLAPSAPAAAVITASKLSSGVQTITRDVNAQMVSLKFCIKGGSSSEKAGQKGAAHFLAKSAFVGTSEASGLKMVRFMESIGASFGAYADKEKIVYDVTVLPDQVEGAVAVVMAAIASAPNASYVYEENKPAAQLDYSKFAADNSAQLHELVQEAAYGETSPLGGSLFAPSLSKLSVPSVLEYRAAHFVRSNLVVAGSGISKAALDALVEKGASQIPDGAAPTLAASAFVGGDAKVRTSGPSQLALAFPVPGGDAGKPYMVLHALLSAKLRSQQVCASAFLTSFSGSAGGLVGMQSAGSATDAAKYIAIAVAELKAIASKCPDIETLKQKVTLENFLALEGESTTAYLLAAHVSGANPASAGDVRSVTTASVSAAASAALKAVPAYAVLGATAGTPSYAEILSMLK
ncbi:Metalloenzyme, LuxS/M16 peptidase-like protein [Ochromonadaceae sp. CCMP2298]|nr:Metalloenzyme, LuxS/M16 peptidase-like protein [Ochromonadaceae sp. CCMP2298]|eukprot:CAMPEP_0173177072 /NCGR_PEP_ID=MMETSP1141-20130122/4797_1 /TAXON_ID=483371 /ORGANISM="non described non described, Strain CCMP2298" /LENGTH=435 /DNA_ID=CAMNT_0014099451 /DNA_START=52 /DNA_END=1359 /DNA_ORIENTATION=-